MLRIINDGRSLGPNGINVLNDGNRSHRTGCQNAQPL
jgi:hypothetical protein